ncbi:1,5-anhydro-D-fructose reductase [Rhypophila decipiens]|uniref:1,5-anhydro-D-fructose reductase n=1 Tax=Rhypophila decipiens TaxID=261697 RepID=A0AAN6XWB8_9PEZI|nr:1,5-anhydro-D-fructose reductase [Rhypophila decipiens]
MKDPVTFQITEDGARLPGRGLGTFQPDPARYPDKSVKQSVLTALKAGYQSGIPRDEIIIVSKLENVYHAPEDVATHLDISLGNLGLDYIDIFIMHFSYAYKKKGPGPYFGTERDPVTNRPIIDVELSRDFPRTWQAMERLVDTGKVKHIGVSNFSSPKVLRLPKSCRIKPVLNQIEVHPHWPQKGLVKTCQDNSVHVTAFGPLGCVPIPSLKYGRTPAQVFLCHLLLRGISVIPKSNSPERILENFDCIFDMAEENFDEIDNLVGENGERGVRNFDSLEYLGFDNYNEEVEEP